MNLAEGLTWYATCKIGEGVYGEVFRAVNDKTGECYALKRIKISDSDAGMPSNTVREIGLLRELDHQNVVKLLDVAYKKVRHQERLLLVFEYIDTDLHSAIVARRKAKRPITTMEACDVVRQLLRGLKYCHSRKIIHRDIKPPNILVSRDGNVKICDFGISRTCITPQRVLTREVVTLWYRAPEILLGARSYTGVIDVWSVGCILAELLFMNALFKGESEFGQIMSIFQTMGTPTTTTWPGVDQLPYFQECFPKWQYLDLREALDIDCPLVADMLTSILSLNPSERPTASIALRHAALRRTTLFIPDPELCNFGENTQQQQQQQQQLQNDILSNG